MPNPALGAFVVPGTGTTLHVGGFLDVSSTYDTGTSPGGAGYLQLSGFDGNSITRNAAFTATGIGLAANSQSGHSSDVAALPGTPDAQRTGRFLIDPRFTRLDIETETPSDYGTVGTVIEFDMEGDGITATQKSSNSYSPRVRRAFVTIGNFLIGQTQQLTYDPGTNVGSIDNNSFMGQEAGNRWSEIQYHWDLAQNNKFFVALEQPYSDVVGIDPGEFWAGGNIGIQTDANNSIPDMSAKFTTDQSWGRFFAAGTLRNINVNTEGLTKAYGSNAAMVVNTDVWGGFVDAGIKINVPFASTSYKDGMGKMDALFANANWGNAGVRGAQYSGGNSAVVDSSGHLQLQATYGFDVGYQHWFSDHWQSNLNFGMQHQDSKIAYQNNQGLWKDGLQAEANLFWIQARGIILV